MDVAHCFQMEINCRLLRLKPTCIMQFIDHFQTLTYKRSMKKLGLDTNESSIFNVFNLFLPVFSSFVKSKIYSNSCHTKSI